MDNHLKDDVLQDLRCDALPSSMEEIIAKAERVQDTVQLTIQSINDINLDELTQGNLEFEKNIGERMKKEAQPLVVLLSDFKLNWSDLIEEMKANDTQKKPKLDRPDSLATSENIGAGNVLREEKESISEIFLGSSLESLPLPDSDFEDDLRFSFSHDVAAKSVSINHDDVVNIIDNLEKDQEVMNLSSYKSPAVQKAQHEEVDISKVFFDNFIDSEKYYCSILFTLSMFNSGVLSCMKNEKNSELISESNKIFGRIIRLERFHHLQLKKLQETGENESKLAKLCDFVLALRETFHIYKAQFDNFPSSTETLHKFWNLKGVISDTIPKNVMLSDLQIQTQDALYKPISRLSDYLTLITEILNHLAYNNDNFNDLTDIKEELTLFSELMKMNPKDKKQTISRRLVKWTPIVEEINSDDRKHRILLLLSDYLICAGESAKGSIVLQWHCALKKLQMIDEVPSMKQASCRFEASTKEAIDAIRLEISKLNSEVDCLKEKRGKKYEKLKRLLEDKMSELILKFSAFPLFIFLADGQKVTLVFMTEDSRKSWEKLLRLRKNSAFMDQRPIFMSEVNHHLESITKNLGDSLRSLINFCLMNNESLHKSSPRSPITPLKGHLFVYIKVSKNADSKAAPHFNIELDKYLENRSPKLSKLSISPREMVSFDVDAFKGLVEISCGKNIKQAPIILFSFNILAEGIDKKPFIRKKKSYRWGEALFFLEFSRDCVTSKHILKFNGLGPSVDEITQFEGSEIPKIIEYSCKYIEEFGLLEVGIYRISGTSSVKEKALEAWREGFMLSYDDVKRIKCSNVVAGVLKQFLRELQVPLVPDPTVDKLLKFDFEKGSIEDFDSVLEEMPVVNRKSFVHILNHLLVVIAQEQSNKMGLSNISVVFALSIFKSSDNDPSSVSKLNILFMKILEFWKDHSPRKDIAISN